MIIKKDELKKLVATYTPMIPRLSWFDESEREALLLEAGQTAEKYNQNFFAICDNLAFMRSILDGKKPPNTTLSTTRNYHTCSSIGTVLARS